MRDQLAEVLSNVRYHLGANKAGLVGLLFVVVVSSCAAFAPLIAPYSPLEVNTGESLSPPSVTHLMGTDRYGRDILSRALFAGRIDIRIALSAVAISFAVSCILGAVAGYTGGAVDEIIMRSMDILMAFPGFILAIGLSVAMGGGTKSVIIALGIVATPVSARIMRGEMIGQKERPYAEAARAIGNSRFRIIFRHLVPNCLPPLVVQGTLSIGYAVLETAGLSFIGIGVHPPTAEWGVMMSEGVAELLSGKWWVSMFPGIMVFMFVLGANLFGDALRNITDPRSRRR